MPSLRDLRCAYTGLFIFKSLYNQIKVDDDHAKVLFTNRMIEPPDEKWDINTCLRSFEPYLLANNKTEKPVLHVSLNPDQKDVLTDEQLTEISQETRLMENEYFVNLPTRFFYRKKWNKGWINVVNPFRATIVLGTLGSGKSYAVVNNYIRQQVAKGFALYVYDYNFDERIEQKIFHAEIVVDNEAVSCETKVYKKIPDILDFWNDTMQAEIEQNYKQVKQDVKQIGINELARIENNPYLRHLIKKDAEKSQISIFYFVYQYFYFYLCPIKN
jgi:hypothetical protein